MEDVQQLRSNPSPQHYFLDSTIDIVDRGMSLQGLWKTDAWVVASTKRCLSYSGQRSRPTMVSSRLSASSLDPTIPMSSSYILS
ncbi:hypothetical protein RHMOL_Rhmol01G0207800 [Rhododendron molle]|uniref:Uncharacterized protein n=1 Tax=Rhododendron molle TaxID=49168 RepID=A0ACC0Q5K3_RHOML|nr:hypothetical protein RHMOL_Rhmol01G0207800 [Rhododendron molle]